MTAHSHTPGNTHCLLPHHLEIFATAPKMETKIWAIFLCVHSFLLSCFWLTEAKNVPFLLFLGAFGLPSFWLCFIHCFGGSGEAWGLGLVLWLAHKCASQNDRAKGLARATRNRHAPCRHNVFKCVGGVGTLFHFCECFLRISFLRRARSSMQLEKKFEFCFWTGK